MSKGAKGKDKDSHHRHHPHHKGESESRSSKGVSASTEKTLFVGVIIIAGVLVLLYLFKGQVWGGTSGPEGGGGNSNFATKLEVDQLRSVYLNDTMSVASFATFVAVWLAITIFCLAWMVAYVKKSVKTKTAANHTLTLSSGNVHANGGTAAVKGGGFFTRYWEYFSGIFLAFSSTADKRDKKRDAADAAATAAAATAAAAPAAAATAAAAPPPGAPPQGPLVSTVAPTPPPQQGDLSQQ
jgi:fatty acid desaturase